MRHCTAPCQESHTPMFKAGRYVKPPPSAQAYCTRLCVLALAAQGSQKDKLLRSWEGRGPVIACKWGVERLKGGGQGVGVSRESETERQSRCL